MFGWKEEVVTLVGCDEVDSAVVLEGNWLCVCLGGLDLSKRVAGRFGFSGFSGRSSLGLQ